jgi:hypothetical protein
MAKHVGVSKATLQRVWSTNDIKPHRTRIFSESVTAMNRTDDNTEA